MSTNRKTIFNKLHYNILDTKEFVDKTKSIGGLGYIDGESIDLQNGTFDHEGDLSAYVTIGYTSGNEPSVPSTQQNMQAYLDWFSNAHLIIQKLDSSGNPTSIDVPCSNCTAGWQNRTVEMSFNYQDPETGFWSWIVSASLLYAPRAITLISGAWCYYDAKKDTWQYNGPQVTGFYIDAEGESTYNVPDMRDVLADVTQVYDNFYNINYYYSGCFEKAISDITELYGCTLSYDIYSYYSEEYGSSPQPVIHRVLTINEKNLRYSGDNYYYILDTVNMNGSEGSQTQEFDEFCGIEYYPEDKRAVIYLKNYYWDQSGRDHEAPYGILNLQVQPSLKKINTEFIDTIKQVSGLPTKPDNVLYTTTKQFNKPLPTSSDGTTTKLGKLYFNRSFSCEQINNLFADAESAGYIDCNNSCTLLEAYDNNTGGWYNLWLEKLDGDPIWYMLHWDSPQDSVIICCGYYDELWYSKFADPLFEYIDFEDSVLQQGDYSNLQFLQDFMFLKDTAVQETFVYENNNWHDVITTPFGSAKNNKVLSVKIHSQVQRTGIPNTGLLTAFPLLGSGTESRNPCFTPDTFFDIAKQLCDDGTSGMHTYTVFRGHDLNMDVDVEMIINQSNNGEADGEWFYDYAALILRVVPQDPNQLTEAVTLLTYEDDGDVRSAYWSNDAYEIAADPSVIPLNVKLESEIDGKLIGDKNDLIKWIVGVDSTITANEYTWVNAGEGGGGGIIITDEWPQEEDPEDPNIYRVAPQKDNPNPTEHWLTMTTQGFGEVSVSVPDSVGEFMVTDDGNNTSTFPVKENMTWREAIGITEGWNGAFELIIGEDSYPGQFVGHAYITYSGDLLIYGHDSSYNAIAVRPDDIITIGANYAVYHYSEPK